MKLAEYTLDFAGECFWLSTHKAMFWPKKQALILADLHLGKAAHFRKNGIPVPTQIGQNDLARLSFLLELYKPKQVIIVGDLVHAGHNNEVKAFKQLTGKFAETEFLLVKGNHDRISEELIAEMGIDHVCNTYQIENIFFNHIHSENDLKPTISGHLHPGISLMLPTKKHIRLPCFVVGNHQLILPAFSEFTGLYTAKIFENASYYAVHDSGIINI
ncbi:ligase-associated DNA damage response endonuclease PdeM [Pedobacter ginsengiterrae]|uniref:Ligase-associated DNA damage response endonuclease PdeM n=1 Tax=Pedobacter ginsengiterrae TaxID=871696 RepID=A0ABP7Q5S9_9SPHI